jgi:hypothetical protein
MVAPSGRRSIAFNRLSLVFGFATEACLRVAAPLPPGSAGTFFFLLIMISTALPLRASSTAFRALLPVANCATRKKDYAISNVVPVELFDGRQTTIS